MCRGWGRRCEAITFTCGLMVPLVLCILMCHWPLGCWQCGLRHVRANGSIACVASVHGSPPIAGVSTGSFVRTPLNPG